MYCNSITDCDKDDSIRTAVIKWALIFDSSFCKGQEIIKWCMNGLLLIYLQLKSLRLLLCYSTAASPRFLLKANAIHTRSIGLTVCEVRTNSVCRTFSEWHRVSKVRCSTAQNNTRQCHKLQLWQRRTFFSMTTPFGSISEWQIFFVSEPPILFLKPDVNFFWQIYSCCARARLDIRNYKLQF